MFLRTHLIIFLFFWLLLFDLIPNPFVFLIIALVATALPDIDNRFSKLGRLKLFRVFNFFVRHRGITHSFIFLVIIAIFLFYFYKDFLIAFIFGYSLHILFDSITIGGVSLFYPLKKKIKGPIKTGGFFENVLFFLFLFADIFLIFLLLLNIL